MSPLQRLGSPIPALILAVSCATTQFDATSEAKKLSERDAEWAAMAATGKDADAVASYWSADAVLYPPGRPLIEGRPAIRDYVLESYKIPGFKIHWTSDKPTLSPDGKMAFMRSTNEVTVPGPKGEPMTIAGRGITVWRVDTDGQWRCVVDIWNNEPTPNK